MQIMIKDYNYLYDFNSSMFKLIYVGDDSSINLYRTYNNLETNLLLRDIQDLSKLGFRFNPYLTESN